MNKLNCIKTGNMIVIKWIFSMFLILTIFSGCKKSSEYIKSNDQFESKVNVKEWLKSQLISGDENNNKSLRGFNSNLNAIKRASILNKNVELISKHLNLSLTKKINTHSTYNIYLIPIDEIIKSEIGLNYKSKNNSLLIISNKEDEIISGYIASVLIDSININIKEDQIEALFSNKKQPSNCKIIISNLVNELVSEVAYDNSKLVSTSFVSNKKLKNKIDEKKSLSNNCIDWYLITTYYYNDGSTYQTETYLGTTCNNTQNDEQLNPDGQGGGVNTNTYAIEYDLNSYDLDDLNQDDPSDINNQAFSSSVYQPLRYRHYSKKVLTNINNFEYLDYVEMQNTSVEPIVSNFIHFSGTIGLRKITLFNHYNYYTSLAPPLAMLNWSCSVHGLYQAQNISTWTRQWTHQFSIVK